MLLSLAFLLLLLPCHSQQSTAHEKKTQAEHSHRSPLVNLSSIAKPSDASSQRTSKKEESPSPAQHPIKVLISNSWIQKDTTAHTTNSTLVQSKELDLERGSPLLLTHQINLVPGACGGCEAEFATLRERLDHLEREVSTLKENCVGAEVIVHESPTLTCSGAACFLRSDGNECPNDCSDQGRCEGGKCVCFPGFKGHDCGSDVCPSDCSGNGQCVNGQCVCDNGYSGLDCANKSCPAPSGSVHIRSRDVTESSVTLFWTQPSVQYSTYHITLKSQKEGDEMRTVNVGGRLTSFTQTGLAAGQKYKVSIKGERDGKLGPESNTEFTTAPSGSVHIQSRDVTESSVTVFWTQPSVQYSAYHITFKSQTEGDERITAKVGGRFTSFTQTGLAAGQKYTVSIRGERDGKMGPWSTTEFTTAPSGSVHIRSRDVTDSSVTLFWTQPSVQYSTYHITFKSQTEGDEMITAKVGGRLTSFTQTRLAAGRKYKVSIRGERDGKMGPESNTEFSTAPSGSVHLRSRDVTESSVTLFWTQPSVQYSTYHITFKSQRVGDEIIPANVGGRLTSFTQPGLAAGQKYKVSIKGERDGKMGPESTTEFTTAPSGSVHIRSRDVTDSSATVFWTQPSVQYNTYHITFKSQREGGEMITAKVGGRLTSFTQTRLAAGQKYKVSIRGERDGKMGPESTTEFTTGESVGKLVSWAW
ncbi:hypothetical protein SKAU_G00221110 [Synaphobranchus kaupii]|uniref:Tenascin n=1 Tax=Synaphobranchus kaupii TaxID=118154 RepID=A0A9Q1IVH9_SYNKA|nr:hypothetical protein SKAU_G00221110 [Synaphobranchus kaupii]